MTLDSDVPPALVARTLVHELGHSLREFAAARQGPPQGIIRSSLPGANQATRPETNDYCLDARRDELRYLLDKAKRLPHLQSELEPQIDGLTRLIVEQGRTPVAGPPSAPRPGSIGSLLNQDPATSAPASPVPAPSGPRPAVPVPAPRNPADPGPDSGDPAGSRRSRAASSPVRAPESDEEFWARMRRLTNSTGWIPPEDVVCVCAPGEPCTCGRRRGEDPPPATSSPSPPVPTTPTTPADPDDPDDPDDPGKPGEPTKPEEDDPRNRPVRVARGGTLWDIAKAWLGPGATESEIWRATLDWYNANRATIGNDPDLIRPGQVLRPPKPRPAQRGPR
jgi:nucleoid-associated protein YgaU